MCEHRGGFATECQIKVNIDTLGHIDEDVGFALNPRAFPPLAQEACVCVGGNFCRRLSDLLFGPLPMHTCVSSEVGVEGILQIHPLRLSNRPN